MKNFTKKKKKKKKDTSPIDCAALAGTAPACTDARPPSMSELAQVALILYLGGADNVELSSYRTPTPTEVATSRRTSQLDPQLVRPPATSIVLKHSRVLAARKRRIGVAAMPLRFLGPR